MTPFSQSFRKFSNLWSIKRLSFLPDLYSVTLALPVCLELQSVVWLIQLEAESVYFILSKVFQCPFNENLFPVSCNEFAANTSAFSWEFCLTLKELGFHRLSGFYWIFFDNNFDQLNFQSLSVWLTINIQWFRRWLRNRSIFLCGKKILIREYCSQNYSAPTLDNVTILRS